MTPRKGEGAHGLVIRPDSYCEGKGDTAKRREASKVELIGGLKNHPDFANLDDRHWASLLYQWDISATNGKPATVKEVAEAVGVHPATLSNWRAREDYLRASEMINMLVLHEWRPVLIQKALKFANRFDDEDLPAAMRKDAQKMATMFLERMLPAPQKETEDTNTSVSIFWSDQGLGENLAGGENKDTPNLREEQPE